MLVVFPEPFTPITSITVKGDCLEKRNSDDCPIGGVSSFAISSRKDRWTCAPLRICSSFARCRRRSMSHKLVPGPTSAPSNASSKLSHRSSLMVSASWTVLLIRLNSCLVRLKKLKRSLPSAFSPCNSSTCSPSFFFGSSSGPRPKNLLSTSASTPYVSLQYLFASSFFFETRRRGHFSLHIRC